MIKKFVTGSKAIIKIDGVPIAYGDKVLFKTEYSLHGWVPDFEKMTATHEGPFGTIGLVRRLPGTEAMWTIDERPGQRHIPGSAQWPEPDSEALEEEYRRWVAKTVFET